MHSHTYLVGKSRVTLIFGDITTSRAEIIVSSDDYLLHMGGGVSASVLRAGGGAVAADASKMTPLRLADVAVSSAGTLPAKYVFHAVTIGPEDAGIPVDAVVRQATQRALRLAASLRCRSIAFPAIGAGVAGIPYEVVASQMASELVSFLVGASEGYDVELYLMDRWSQMSREDFFIFFEAFAARTLGLDASSGGPQTVLAPPSQVAWGMTPELAAGAERRHQVYEMLRHLDARRDAIESDLVRTLSGRAGAGDQPVSKLHEQLEELRVLRAGYQAELEGEGGSHRGAADSVFVSSTSLDLKEHRRAVRSAIESLDLTFVGMEQFSPTAQAPADLIRAKVIGAHAYVGIIGMRYGSVDESTGLSMTELEYRQAVASDKALLMFVMDKDAPILASMVEDDPVRFGKLVDFRNRVMTAHTCVLFSRSEDLAKKAASGLREIFPA